MALVGCSLGLQKDEHPAHPDYPTADAVTDGSNDLHQQKAVLEPSEGVNLSSGPDEDTDLWSLIGQSLHWEHVDNPRVEKYLEHYRTRPAYIYRVTERAAPYLHHIVSTIEQRGLPMELALVPLIESGFDPLAYSSGGAAGLWQFMPGTGRHFGLEQNWWFDGRRDVVKSTLAALRYFEQLNLNFSGDWYLTLAAYNSGPGRVRRAIEVNDQHNRPVDYWSLALPRETKNYIPKLIALSKIISDPGAYGIKLASIADQPIWGPVDTGGQLDLAMAADMAGISLQDLHQLNPGLERWATPPDGPHVLQLPIAAGLQFQHNIADLDPDQRITWDQYRIVPGDTLSGIASQHKTSVAVIRQSNKLVSDRIRAGDTLLIPRGSAQSLAFAKQLETRHRGTPTSGQRKKVEYAVKSGDSLWSIARIYGTSPRNLASWNGITTGDTIHPGQVLALYPGQRRKAD